MKRKLHLRADDLRIDTFAVRGPAAAPGTVRGAQETWELCDTQDFTCTEPTGPGYVTIPPRRMECVIC